MKKILHYFVHLFGWNYGTVYSELRGESVWIGFKCSGCGKISGLHCADKIIDDELFKEKKNEKY